MSDSVSYEASERAGVTVVAIGGRLDAITAGTVRERLVALAQGPVRVALDLSRLEWIDSSGVGALISLFKRARTAGGDVKVGGLQAQPKEIFRLLRLEAALEVLPTVDEAVARLAGEGPR